MVMDLDLAGYLDRFQDICQTKFSRTYNFRKLEKRYDPLRAGKRWLVAKDVMHLFDPKETPLARYWGLPNVKDAKADPWHLHAKSSKLWCI